MHHIEPMRDAVRAHRLANALQSAVILIAMAGLLAALGWALAGPSGAVAAIAAGVAVVTFAPSWSPAQVMRMSGAQLLSRRVAPELNAAMALLAERAGLNAVPKLYYVQSPALNAFAMASGSDAAIGITAGLLHTLTRRELVGVLAHELSHVRHADMWVMGLGELFARMSASLSWFGQVALIISAPLALFGGVAVNWLAIALLVLAPTLSGLLQLALSRSREFDADAGAVRLTGDPRGLAMALVKLERLGGGFFERLWASTRRPHEPTWMRSHPPTQARVRRLLEMERDATTP